MKGIVKKIVSVLLLFVIAGLVYACIKSIMEPINFNKQKAYRETVGIQRMKDVRTLQEAFKSVSGHFTASADSLVDFYKNGKMEVIMQIGSNDDSLAVATTEKLKKSRRGITPEQMYELYKKGEHLVFSISSKVDVKDTLFNTRNDFNIDSLKYIPFSQGDTIQMESVIKEVSGVKVPLFEARMPYKSLLKGLDNQLRINLDADRKAMNRYEGLQVGSVSAPNNNAGNWE
ncbi:putative uncharacterized protein [Bacteroides sp. CAG:545]|jgi:hypothetical protein|nr:hypothetical protein [Bacteroidales bacterium]CCZ43209.1 putative uncharacterized protein [Bacteroides sp. CAG:545]